MTDNKKFCWGCIVDKKLTQFKKRDDYRQGICNDCVEIQERNLKNGIYKILERDRCPHDSQWHQGLVTITDVYIKNSRDKENYIKGYIKGTSQYEMGIFEKINQFIDTNGDFITFYGGASPFLLLSMMDEANYTFGKAYKCELKYYKSMNVWDFHGNLREVSSAFHFRTYKKSYAKLLAQALKLRKNIKIKI